MILVTATFPCISSARIPTGKQGRALDRVVRERTGLVTDAEVFQEILHRYVAIDRLSETVGA